jgi:plasmid maintenance system antidote protein VapI
MKNDKYNPDQLLLDTLLTKLQLKNDAALARALEMSPPQISKIRHNRIKVGSTMLIRMHEASELSIRDLKALAGLA